MITTAKGTAAIKAAVTVPVAGIKRADGVTLEKARQRERDPMSAAFFLESALGRPLGKVHTLSRAKFSGLITHPMLPRKEAFKVAPVSALFAAAHGAFELHLGLSLRPEVVWYAVLHEVGRYVHQNVAQCAAVFNGDPAQKKILKVRDDSLVYGSPDNNWAKTLQMFRPQLEEHIDDVSAFVPELSTLDEESRVSLLGAFMEAASSYYRYEVHTLCGIPMLRFVGKPEDWNILVASAQTLAAKLPGLKGYFNDLIEVLEILAGIVARGDGERDFLSSPYKYHGGSGTPYVQGWLTALLAFMPKEKGNFLLRKSFNWRQSRFGTTDFPSHVSATPVTWNYYGTSHELQLLTGILGADYEQRENFLEPRLGWGLTEPAQG